VGQLNAETEAVKLPTQQAGSNIVYAWKVGDPIDAPDASGNYPAWETARSRYWQNRAASAYPGEFSRQNLGLMRRGDAPMVRIIARSRDTGIEVELLVSKELHHIVGRSGPTPHAPSNLMEVWPWRHEAVDPQRHFGYDFVRFK
jgi:hypothetical protein